MCLCAVVHFFFSLLVAAVVCQNHNRLGGGDGGNEREAMLLGRSTRRGQARAELSPSFAPPTHTHTQTDTHSRQHNGSQPGSIERGQAAAAAASIRSDFGTWSVSLVAAWNETE